MGTLSRLQGAMVQTACCIYYVALTMLMLTLGNADKELPQGRETPDRIFCASRDLRALHMLRQSANQAHVRVRCAEDSLI